ncbi:MAG: FAD-linked oxidase C-terminal domain-containing protein [Elusimicrobiota bacterium]
MKSNQTYHKVTPKIIDQLVKIVGGENLFVGQDWQGYDHDETPEIICPPEVVIKPKNAEEISRILKLANQEKIPVTPRGAGTGLSGGALSVLGGILISFERMNNILEIDVDNLMATVQPGVIVGNLRREAETYGLLYPVDPASLDSCSIGGNVAECAGGASAVKYGVTKNYVCGMEVALPTGEILSLGGKLVKNVTGYDLIGLIVGSEGTLALVTKIILKLIPLPKVKLDLLVPFDSLEEAAKTVSAIIRHKTIPTSIEFMDKEIIQICEKFLQRKLPFSDAEAHLLIEIDGQRKEDVDWLAEEIGKICMEHQAKDILVASNKPEQDKLWEARRSIREAIKSAGITIDEDIVVPRSQVPVFVQKSRQLCQKYSLKVINCGHAGDGNIHVNIMKKDSPEQPWEVIKPKVIKELFQLALSLGGMISGEHGIGITKKDYLELALGKEQIELLKRIKLAFDPNHILNPGKIF